VYGGTTTECDFSTSRTTPSVMIFMYIARRTCTGEGERQNPPQKALISPRRNKSEGKSTSVGSCAYAFSGSG
jgi:hypothetical protein